MTTGDHAVVTLEEYYSPMKTHELQAHFEASLNERRRHVIAGILQSRGAYIPAIPNDSPPMVMSDEVVERVARSMCRGKGLDPDDLFPRKLAGGSTVMTPRWRLFIPQSEEKIAGA